MKSLPVLCRATFDAYELLFLPIWVFSVDTLEIMASNGAARDWLGYDAATLHSLTIADIRPEEDRRRLREQVRAFDAPSGDAGLWTMIASSGDRFSVRANWSRVRFEGVEAIIASIRDVTQIRMAEEQTRSLTSEVEALRRTITLSGGSTYRTSWTPCRA